MDPVIIDISTKVMPVLLPFVTKGAEEFASKVGDAPERYKVVLEDILQEKLSADEDLASKLSHLLQEMGPALDIIQTMDEGKEITGLKAKEMRSGRARVTQDIAKGERITGAEFERLG